MKRPVLWLVGAVVLVILYLWLDDGGGLYVGSEIYSAEATLRGEPVEAQRLRCRYFTLRGVESSAGGWVAGTDPATLLPDGTQPIVAETGCPFYWPWHGLTAL